MITVYNQEQLALIKRTIAVGCTDDELALFANVAKKTGLDPFSKQIYAIKRKQWDSDVGAYVEKMTIQTSIDGYRVIAERSGKYSGQNGPWWCGKDGIWKDVWCGDELPFAAKVEVMRSDFSAPLVGIAKWSEFAAKKKDGGLMGLWAKLPTVMLAKCAESLALRKAFPNDIGELRTSEEMEQADAPEPKVAAVTGAVVSKKPEWSDDEKTEAGSLIAEIYQIGLEAGEKEVALIRSRMRYDAPRDVIDELTKLAQKWRDIKGETSDHA